ncbi:MAG TPA: glycosyltransferase family 39 protein [Ktedonobacteraceae bacterium]
MRRSNLKWAKHTWFWSLLAAIGIVLLALAFDLYRLGAPSIWFDEAFSVELARQPLPLLWHIIFGPEPNMELYYLFLHFWLTLTAAVGLHPTETVVRLPSVLFAVLASLLVFVLGRHFLGLAGGITGAILYLLNDLQLLYAQQTRSYSMQLLLLCLSWYALLIALTSQRRRYYYSWWALYILSTTLAIYAHLFSMLVVFTQCVAVGGLLILPMAWRPLARARVILFAISLLATGILSIPMLLVSLQGAKTSWLPVPHLHDVLYFFYTMTGYSKGYTVALGLGCLLAVLLVTVSTNVVIRRWNVIAEPVQKFVRADRELLPFVWTMLCWCVVPLVVSYVVSQGSTRLFSSRYLVVVVPPIMLLVGACVASLRWRVVQLALALVMVILAARAVPYYYRSAQVEDWNSTVHWLEQRYQQGDGLVCYDNTVAGSVKQGCQIAVQYYLDAYPGTAHFTSDTPGAFSWSTYSAPDPEAAIRPSDLVAFGRNHPRIFLIVGRVQNDAAAQRVTTALHWLNSHDHLVSQVNTRTVNIYLFDTKQGDHKGAP